MYGLIDHQYGKKKHCCYPTNLQPFYPIQERNPQEANQTELNINIIKPGYCDGCRATINSVKDDKEMTDNRG